MIEPLELTIAEIALASGGQVRATRTEVRQVDEYLKGDRNLPESSALGATLNAVIGNPALTRAALRRLRKHPAVRLLVAIYLRDPARDFSNVIGSWEREFERVHDWMFVLGDAPEFRAWRKGSPEPISFSGQLRSIKSSVTVAELSDRLAAMATDDLDDEAWVCLNGIEAARRLMSSAPEVAPILRELGDRYINNLPEILAADVGPEAGYVLYTYIQGLDKLGAPEDALTVLQNALVVLADYPVLAEQVREHWAGTARRLATRIARRRKDEGGNS